MNKLRVEWLGRIAFENALELQERLVAEKAEKHSEDVLLLLEHEPVYTIGRTQDRSSLHDAEQLPHPVVEINRGGEATYHGPGQLVGYPLIDLRRRGKDLHKYLRDLEDMLIETLSGFGIAGLRREGLTGVWVEDRKIASIGVGVRKWISMHGFALNVCGELTPFQEITPCGIVGVEMTSVTQESGAEKSVRELGDAVAAVFTRQFGYDL
jgi:lipoyl(octanoyl) transferase